MLQPERWNGVGWGEVEVAWWDLSGLAPNADNQFLNISVSNFPIRFLSSSRPRAAHPSLCHSLPLSLPPSHSLSPSFPIFFSIIRLIYFLVAAARAAA